MWQKKKRSCVTTSPGSVLRTKKHIVILKRILFNKMDYLKLDWSSADLEEVFERINSRQNIKTTNKNIYVEDIHQKGCILTW